MFLKEMWSKFVRGVKAPFIWGYEAVDARPTGRTYRKITAAVRAHAMPDGKVMLVVGKGKVREMKSVGVLAGKTTEEVANSALDWVHDMRRSTAREIRRTEKEVLKHAEDVEAGEAAPKPAGRRTHRSASPHGGGEAILIEPAGAGAA